MLARWPIVVISLVSIVFCGCGERGEKGPFSKQLDVDSSNRLALVYRPVGLGIFNQRDYEFRSLEWKVKSASAWTNKVIIDRKLFQGTNAGKRWIADLKGLNPATGTAIIKIAEGDAPIESPTVTYVYSWREWNLFSNSQVRLLRVCKNPFEPY